MIDLPDLPRWVEAHGIAADPEGWREELGGGFIVGHDRAKLIVVAGDVETSDVATLANRPHVILVEREELGLALGRRCDRAILHTLPDPSALPDYEGATALGDAPLPAALADELAWARTRGRARGAKPWLPSSIAAPIAGPSFGMAFGSSKAGRRTGGAPSDWPARFGFSTGIWPHRSVARPRRIRPTPGCATAGPAPSAR